MSLDGKEIFDKNVRMIQKNDLENFKLLLILILSMHSITQSINRKYYKRPTLCFAVSLWIPPSKLSLTLITPLLVYLPSM